MFHENMESDTNLSVIKETRDYSKFIPNRELKNSKRVKYLTWRKIYYFQPLPIIEVRRKGDKFEVVGDMDSYYAAVMSNSEICYYESFNTDTVAYKRTLQLSEDEIDWMVTTMQLYEALLSEEEKS